MIRHDEDLLEYFRGRPCELCHADKLPNQPHHIVCRGLGGGSRLDTALNLVTLCAICHFNVQNGGEARRKECLAIVAAREGLEGPDVVQEALWRLVRKPKP